jgi:hypothetical protein
LLRAERAARAEESPSSSAQPADTVFWRALQGEFDVVVALYHDQGLAPLKTVDFDEAVNVTLGLPYLRTSPDHGTAFDIAGKGVARARSFTRAVEVALAVDVDQPSLGVGVLLNALLEMLENEPSADLCGSSIRWVWEDDSLLAEEPFPDLRGCSVTSAIRQLLQERRVGLKADTLDFVRHRLFSEAQGNLKQEQLLECEPSVRGRPPLRQSLNIGAPTREMALRNRRSDRQQPTL